MFCLSMNKSIMREILSAVYKNYAKELKEKCPQLLADEYSNPHYAAIPDGWEEAHRRIMIVGKEGYGDLGSGKRDGLTVDDIVKIQDTNKAIVEKITDTKKDNRKFWQRFIKIAENDCSCVWNNIDKIFIKGKVKCSLGDAERIALHSTSIKILQEEIKILKPQTVVFFGWYRQSLAAELPEIYKDFYENGNYIEFNKKIYKVSKDGINYIFSNHPSWRGRYKPADYENNVITCVKESLERL